MGCLKKLQGLFLGLLATGSVAAGPFLPSFWSARDLDGNLQNGPEAYYDSRLNISILHDANSVSNPNGAQHYGIDGWRPPKAPVAPEGCNTFIVYVADSYGPIALCLGASQEAFVSMGEPAAFVANLIPEGGDLMMTRETMSTAVNDLINGQTGDAKTGGTWYLKRYFSNAMMYELVPGEPYSSENAFKNVFDGDVGLFSQRLPEPGSIALVMVAVGAGVATRRRQGTRA